VLCPDGEVDAATVGEALDAYFRVHPQARGYVLEEDGALRRHVMLFVNGQAIRQRRLLSDPLAPASVVDVLQALSGG